MEQARNSNILVPNERIEELINFLQSYRDTFELELEQMPIPVAILEKQFNQFCIEHRSVVRGFLQQKFQLDDISDYDTQKIMQGEILDPIIDDMSKDIYDKTWEIYVNFLKQLNIEQLFELENFLMKMQEKSSEVDEFFINTLIKEQSLYFKSPKYSTKTTLLQRARVINDCLNQLYILLMKLYQKICAKYQIVSQFKRKLVLLIPKLIYTLLLTFQLKNTQIYNEVNKIIEKCCQTSVQQIEQEIKSNLQGENMGVASYLKYGKQFKLLYNNLFLEDLKSKNNLGFYPCEILTKQYQNIISQKTDELINQKLEDIRHNFEDLEKKLHPLFINILNNFLENKIHGFQLNDIQMNWFYTIIACAPGIVQNKESFGQFLEFINDFHGNNDFKKDENNNKITQIVNQGYDNFMMQKFFLNQRLEESAKSWSIQINEQTNLSVIFYLYMKLSNFQIDQKNKNIQIKEFTPINRFFLKIITRYLKNGEYSYLNYQIISILDSLFETIIIQDTQQIPNISLYSITYQNEFHTFLTMMRTSLSQQNLKEPLVQFNEQLQEKFLIRKVSGKKVSRNIVLFISGLQINNENEIFNWSDLSERYPEMEIFSLDYVKNNTQKTDNKIKLQIQNFNRSSLPSQQDASLTFFLTNSYENNQFQLEQKQAIKCGKILGKYLSENKILFPNCTVSLIGYSFGTYVVQSCLQFLEEKNYQNIIYEVLYLGGFVDTSKINPVLQSVSGRLINCYLNKDQILKYAYQLEKTEIKPIGLNQIQCNSNKFINYDLSDIITDHVGYASQLAQIIKLVDFNRDIYSITEIK